MNKKELNDLVERAVRFESPEVVYLQAKMLEALAKAMLAASAEGTLAVLENSPDEKLSIDGSVIFVREDKVYEYDDEPLKTLERRVANLSKRVKERKTMLQTIQSGAKDELGRPLKKAKCTKKKVIVTRL